MSAIYLVQQLNVYVRWNFVYNSSTSSSFYTVINGCGHRQFRSVLAVETIVHVTSVLREPGVLIPFALSDLTALEILFATEVPYPNLSAAVVRS